MIESHDPGGHRQTEVLNSPKDVEMSDEAIQTTKLPKAVKSHEITSRTIKSPAFSYAWLQIISDPPTKLPLDNITVRSYLTAAFTQFLGLTGSAISVDILKIEDKECWIRVPREDLSAVVAALGGWMARGDNGGEVAWRIRGSGNWLGSLSNRENVEKLWS
jgi:ribonuclease P/MRP protein subunit POP8